MPVKYQQTARSKRRPAPVSVKNIKKHSDIVKAISKSVTVVGNKTRTDTGYVIDGYHGKNIETYYEVMLPGTTSNILTHPKKDKVIRVMSGTGIAVLREVEGNTVDKTITAGDEIILKAGIIYRLATTSNQALEFYVTQDSNYKAREQVLQNTAVSTDVPEAMLMPNIRELENTPVRKDTRDSKAVTQQQHRMAKRVQSGQAVTEAAKLTVATAAPILNAKPSFGRFAEEEAG